jgi:hypothetical protein
VWDLEKVIVEQKLKPRQKSQPRRLQLLLADVPSLSEAAIRSRGWAVLELMHLEARVLANVERNTSATQK